ncbi:protein-S-isoprenylcysteine O-methyltransferase isoform X1 [Dendroctonus ponderosae]|uniref:Protein-S-isoprenylcysteine O-methyltransferase n=2 Tax=Dendroctonus ponderosae TaxID=77166 RepID=U4TVP3_DENPD|nr:protein-S-isoprenylcysteine O-methyltransferase isoform X1 [Dendroctonus ponderosae]ERL84837.1 hypothetical protein D910_02261 [Dendroctonus ponderosae]KAH1024042.1 hypothetical protein HUJ05_003606 [Dendroctonus ponderosae]
MTSHKQIAITHFVVSFILFSITCALNYVYTILSFDLTTLICLQSLVIIITFIGAHIGEDKISIPCRASMLGGLFALGIYINFATSPHLRVFGIYLSVMAFFHFSEFIAIAMIQPNQVTANSFVLNHSPQYNIAAVTSWVEFFLEAYFFPDLKEHFYVSYLGLVMCIAGEFLRKLAMLTAGRNFNHLVQSEKASDHVLVTDGVYSFFRHPSYVGWFYWAIGTQIILLNPLCIPAYAAVSWIFFNSRIYIEEITLLNFFGQSYVNYQKVVSTGLPFIKGYEI